jgi:hypothetical protein
MSSLLQQLEYRKRLNEIKINYQKTQWSENLEDLEGVSKTVKESILILWCLES